MGVLEAVGLEFDNLILVGFNSKNWPNRYQLNPFLPVLFQKQHDMPGSSVEREYQYTQELSDKLLKSSPRIWITQSHSHQDMSDVQASPFFADYPLEDQTQLAKGLSLKKVLTTDYEWKLERNLQLNKKDLSGGARLLSEYATFPFVAMSKFIFDLKALKQEEPGFNPKLKGLWLHKSMELIWKELGDQKALLALSEELLNQLINEKVTSAEKFYRTEFQHYVSLELIDIEKQRLISRIQEWLSIEKSRDYFRVETEVEKTLSIGGLDLNLRIDRVDYDAQDRIEIIDYKTGNTDIKAWLGERPEDAQMPIYALAFENENIKSISYAQIKTGDIKRVGVWFKSEIDQALEKESKQDKVLNSTFLFLQHNLQGEKQLSIRNLDLPTNKKALLNYWRDNLTSLANQILHGELPLFPSKDKTDARHTDYLDFARMTDKQPQKLIEEKSYESE
jgi:hypothetical protein